MPRENTTMIKTILFDLDGTLLPMDEEKFIKTYMGGLAKTMAPFGYDPQQLVKTVWAGTKAMIANDGSKTNEQVFWDVYTQVYGPEKRTDEQHFAKFYQNDFAITKSACGFNEKVPPLMEKLKQLGLKIIIATNPFFPKTATHQRLAWAGLNPNDFALVTTYENSRFCKPNLAYYQDILDKFDLKAEECIMVGNDVGEDMIAQKLGLKVFLLTDQLINDDNLPWEHIPHGDMYDLQLFLQDNLENW